MHPSGHPPTGFSRLAQLLREGPFAVLTGAGLSTGSGIPAYRDQNGIWQQRRPIQHQDFLASEATRRRYWARSFVGWPRIEQAQTNAGHRALSELEQAGFVSSLITQNVDGLHQQAGSRSVIELHGGLSQVICLSCQQRFSRQAVQSWLASANPLFDQEAVALADMRPDGDAQLQDHAYASFEVPECPQCGGILKPDVVFFGDNVPRERVALATSLVEQSAGLLVVGSSLVVYSGYRFATLTAQLGKPLVAINLGTTRADDLLTIKIDAECSATLSQLVQALQAC